MLGRTGDGAVRHRRTAPPSWRRPSPRGGPGGLGRGRRAPPLGLPHLGRERRGSALHAGAGAARGRAEGRRGFCLGGAVIDDGAIVMLTGGSVFQVGPEQLVVNMLAAGRGDLDRRRTPFTSTTGSRSSGS